MNHKFWCRECGRHIISIGNQRFHEIHPDLCAACWSFPNWWEDPELARAIDPHHERTLR